MLIEAAFYSFFFFFFHAFFFLFFVFFFALDDLSYTVLAFFPSNVSGPFARGRFPLPLRVNGSRLAASRQNVLHKLSMFYYPMHVFLFLGMVMLFLAVVLEIGSASPTAAR